MLCLKKDNKMIEHKEFKLIHFIIDHYHVILNLK